ncbi:MAG: FlaD/FlaE family flagellar protein [Halobacteria archaeon]|nr:FlaD/FlaE family flagellar protein [Halobacteria archaeon]
MSINPREYDVDELREAASLDEALLTQKEDGEAYLEGMPDSKAKEIVSLKWADYLVSSMGIRRAYKALDLYLDLGWISDEVKSSMEKRLREVDGSSTTGVNQKPVKLVEEITETPFMTKIPFDEHITSLVFIAHLAGDDIEAFLNSVQPLESRTNVDVVDVFTGEGEAKEGER